ncbi:MAG: gamma-glutamyltransferase [Candidatus Aminicenantales bacterium]
MRRAAALAMISWLFLAVLAGLSCRSPKGSLPEPTRDKHAPFNYIGTKGMVVAAQPLAAAAGLDMLKRGGNAVDAAVATAFALNAAEPFASGLGGGGFMVIYVARTKKVTIVNFREKAPAAATPTMFTEKGERQDEWRQERGTAVGVPGMLAGWNYALKKYGTRSLTQAAAWAIEIAETGFPVSATFSQIDKDEYEKLLKNAGEGSRYLNGGIPFEPGEVFKNPELAATLRLICAKGPDEFYKGEIAKKIVAAVRAKDGIMTLEDLAAYQPVEADPIKGTYRGYTIYTLPPPGTGGLHIIQLLNVAEGWPLKKWGPATPASIHHLSEAMRFIFADKDRYDGDPDFVSIPIGLLTSKDYAQEIRNRIGADRVAGQYSTAKSDPVQEKKENTTHVGVIDEEGNIVALTQSINDFFGTGIVPEGTGFLLNDHMADFSTDPDSPNAPRPNRRPVSNMGPLIMFKDGKPFLSLGSPGGPRIFPSLVQIIINIVDFGMSLDEAIEAPRFFTYSSGGKARPIAVEPRISKATLQALEKLGHKITLKDPYDKYFGGAQGLMILRGGKLIHGGADSRRDGVGAGY